MEVKPQIILSSEEYEYLLSSQKQNLETKNTWENHFNRLADVNRRNYEAEIKELKQRHEAEITQIMMNAIENKTHAIAFFSTLKSSAEIIDTLDPLCAGKLVPTSIWKFVPIEKINSCIRIWKRLLTRL